MIVVLSRAILLVLSFVSIVHADDLIDSLIPNDFDICAAIDSAISTWSQVYYPGSKQYDDDIKHWASSSTQNSICTVQPGTTDDVGKILQILGENRTPFGVKSGGHTGNPGFSSSEGVLIVMTQFKEVEYDASTQTAIVGTGLVFDKVYSQLAQHGVSVLGGRVPGIGVGGFVLGGGYAWNTNQYGLAVDSVTAFELVKPSGDVANVTEETDAELFFGLKGGFNNFGIVTRITMKAYNQTAVWGGTIIYPVTAFKKVSAAVARFSTDNKDPKANIIATYSCATIMPIATVILYYDAPSPPPGLFQDFLNIKFPISRKVQESSLVDFIKSIPSDVTSGLRGIFHTVPLAAYSQNMVQTIQNEATSSCLDASKAGIFISWSIEPFLPSILSHNTAPSAYPPTRDKAYLPMYLYFAWTLKARDANFSEAIKRSAERIRSAAVAEGQDIANAALYPNYAINDTSISGMYGGNVERLKALKGEVDPSNVMGLAGGFKF